jgi:tRNA modification GTPase
VIEADLVLGGYLVRIADTAGLRETHDVVEIEGIRRAQDWASGAGLRLWLMDARFHVEHLTPPGPDDWWVFTHADLVDPGALPIRQPYCFAVDARHRDGLGDLVAALSEHVARVLSGGDFPAVTRQRHRQIVTDARAAVDRAIRGFGGGPELVGEDVRLAARALERLTGRIGSEDVLDEVFRSFCIGK